MTRRHAAGQGEARPRTLTRVLRLTAGVLAAVVFAGCGGGGRHDAVAAAEAWLKAVGERDADAACALMDESAVDAIRARSRLDPETPCLTVVRAYGDDFAPGDIDAILEIGLEAEGAVKDAEVGVFPASGPRAFQVVLMRRSGDRWKVAATSLGPSGPEPDEAGS